MTIDACSLSHLGMAKAFCGGAGANEYVFTVEAPAGLAWPEQVAAVERTYDAMLHARGLSRNSAVFRRIFLSDSLNQSPAVLACGLASVPAASPVAVSIVQQPPLSGAKIAMLAYHIDGPIEKKRLSDRHLLVRRSGCRHVWSTSLRARQVGVAATAVEAGTGTQDAFADLISALAGQGATLRDHCVRTWIYMTDVDLFYAGMVAARTRLFEQNGLGRTGHTIASTGIEGGGLRHGDIVTMDAYSIADLTPGQIHYLNDFEHMCRSNDYAVTFERGTRISYADRAHLLISGTASIDKVGQVLHIGNVVAQLHRAVENVEALLHAGGARLSDMLYWIVYVRDASDYPLVKAAWSEYAADVPAVFVRGAVCRPQWLIEIEGVAAIPNTDPELPVF